MPVRSFVRLALTAGVVAALSTGAQALPPPDQVKQLVDASMPIADLAQKLSDTRAAETDPHSLLASCLMVDQEKLELLYIQANAVFGLAQLGNGMKDKTDVATVEAAYRDNLAGLKEMVRRVVGITAGEPAACTALPFYTVNAGAMKAAENSALMIVGLLSM